LSRVSLKNGREQAAMRPPPRQSA